MTTATVRPEYWREGDFLYANGRWYELVDGQWAVVDEQNVRTALEQRRNDYPDTAYVTQDVLGEASAWPSQPTPQERDAQEPVAGAWAADPGSAPKPKDYDSGGLNAKDIAADKQAYETAYAQWEVRNRLYQAFQKAEYDRKIKEGQKPDKTNYRPERYTDPQTGQVYERTSPDGAWDRIDAPQAKQAKPDPILSYDEMIYQAVARGDLSRAVAIDAFRDSLGVDRLSVANGVMSFFLTNQDAATIRGWIAAPATMPKLLGQALDIYQNALNPTGGVDINAVMSQNQQAPTWQEMGTQFAMAGGKAKDPYTGKPLFDPNQPFPGQPGGTPTGAPIPSPAVNGQVTGNTVAAANAQSNDRTGFNPDDYSTSYSRPQEQARGFDRQGGPQTVDPQAAYGFDPRMLDRSNEIAKAAEQRMNPAYGYQQAVQAFDRETGAVDNPLVSPQEQARQNAIRAQQAVDRASGASDDPTARNYQRLAAGQQSPWNAYGPAPATNADVGQAAIDKAKGRYDFFTNPSEEARQAGAAPMGVQEASQNSGYYGPEWDAYQEARDRQAAIAARNAPPKPATQPYGNYADILGPYADAAARAEEAKRRANPKKTPIYSA